MKYNYITIGDNKRLHYAINNRISELEELSKNNPDLQESITQLINLYNETLYKFENIEEIIDCD